MRLWGWSVKQGVSQGLPVSSSKNPVCSFPETCRRMRIFLSFNAADDISRVKLSVQTHSTDDYINANYMPVSDGCSQPEVSSQSERFFLCLWWWLSFLFLGLPFQERFHCHTRTFTQHFERFLAYGLGEKCVCHCYVDQMCGTGKGKYLLRKI